MWILQSTFVIAITLLSQLPKTHGQNQCTAVAVATCGSYPCVQTGDSFSCLCTDMSLQPSAAQCNGGIIITTTTSPIIIPNQCANAVCPVGATCIPTNQNPPLYVCLCANNVIANPDCPSVIGNNPCTLNNPCSNGGTCVVNQITNQAVCVCPSGTYGTNCAYGCRPACDTNWCYNGARCTNAYGQAYCSCAQNYRGRRCELRYNKQNYGYLYHNPRW